MSSKRDEHSAGDHPFPLLHLVDHLPAKHILTELMTSMYAVSIMIWDQDGTILSANDVVARGFQQPSVDSMIGKNIAQLAPPEWAQERIKVARLALESKLRITFLEILGGYRLRTLFRPMTATDDTKPGYLLITVEQLTAREFEYASSERTNEMVIYANVIDLGRLDVLSNREIEVLALMGQGYRAKDIADRLCRSVSTIDNHRDNIGDKLDIHDRGELINLAKLAALQVEDAQRTRVQFSKYVDGPPK